MLSLRGVRLGSQTTYAALRVLLSESQYDSRTQTEDPSPYKYNLYSIYRQADTISTSTWKAKMLLV
jgi:hypothetical protein